MVGPDGRCFFVAWVVNMSVIALKHDRSKPNSQNRRVSHPFQYLAWVC